MRARAVVLRNENEGRFHQLCDELEAEWQLQTTTEMALLEKMAVAQWKLVRAERREAIVCDVYPDEKQEAMLEHTATADAYEVKYAGLMADVNQRLADLIPPGADVAEVAREIVRIVDTAPGTRPFRVHIDPSRDGSEVVSVVADRIRAEFYHRVGLSDLLSAGSSV